MKQLTNKQSLSYMLPNSHLVNSLPFIDQHIDSSIPKSKVNYLIKAQQQQMQTPLEEYLKELPMPQLQVAGTPEFQTEVKRVEAAVAQKEKEKEEGKGKKKESMVPEPPKKINNNQADSVNQLVHTGLMAFQNSQAKFLNLELYKKYGPLVLKQIIDVLDREKVNLTSAITTERATLESLNQQRKYGQTESYQKEHDIAERVKIMVNKRIKLE